MLRLAQQDNNELLSIITQSDAVKDLVVNREMRNKQSTMKNGANTIGAQPSASNNIDS
jgi:hypothetical protein